MFVIFYTLSFYKLNFLYKKVYINQKVIFLIINNIFLVNLLMKIIINLNKNLIIFFILLKKKYFIYILYIKKQKNHFFKFYS